jgi:hypothetical protein
MADWTDDATLTAALAAGKAYTDEKAQAQVENPVAITEGATGAPRIHPAALSGYRGRVALSGTTEVEYLDLDRYQVLRIDAVLGGQNAATSGRLEIAYSDDNGATWGSWQNFDPFLPSNNTTSTLRRDMIGTLHISLVSGVVCYRGTLTGNTASGAQSAIAVWGLLSHTVPADCNAIKFRYANAASNNGYLDLEGLSGVAS